MKPRSDLMIARRLLTQSRPHWLHFVIVLGLGLLSAPLALLTPVPLKLAVDHVLGSAPLPGWLPSALLDSPSVLLTFAAVLVVISSLLQNL